MNSVTEIKQLANERLKDAKILLKSKRYEGAFYLAGYAVELTLKAKMCTHLNIDDLFSESPTSHSKRNLGKFKEIVKTHDFFLLLNLCGLSRKIEVERNNNRYFQANLSLIFQENTPLWNESVRYQQGHITAKTVAKIINFLTEPTKGLLQWIENN